MAITPTPEQEAVRAAFATGEHVVVTAMAGTGKAQRNDQPVLTNKGWRPIGDLAIGDWVFGADGRPCRVLGVYPQGVRPLFEVVTRSARGAGSEVSVIADADHLWSTETTLDRQMWQQGYPRNFQVRTTDQIASTLTVQHNGRDRVNHYLPVAEPVQFPELEQPLDPWLIGALISDGSLTSGTPCVSKIDEFFLNAVRDRLPENVELVFASGCTWRLSGRSNGPNPVVSVLRELSLWEKHAWEKTIPELYMRGSVDQRTALLHGLMDGDGSSDSRGGVGLEWTSTSEQLVSQFVELVHSLGGTASVTSRVTSYTHNGERRQGRRSWRVSPVLPEGMALFRWHGEKVACSRSRVKYHPRRTIVAVRPVENAEATCIEVDSPDHLYLTAGCVPTHNTSTLNMCARDNPERKMTYVAFNRAIADEAARKFPDNIIAKTMHGFAYAKVGYRFRERLNAPRLRPSRVADILGLPARWEFGTLNLREHQLARLVMESVGRFCHSADDSPQPSCVPNVNGIDTDEGRLALVTFLFPFVLKAWDDLKWPGGQLRYTHDCYLKMYAMTNPTLPGEVVLADEWQDADPVIQQIVNGQDKQIIAVGDENQQIYCQPPGTLVAMADGSERKIEDVVAGDKVVAYKDRRVFLHGRAVCSVTRVPHHGSIVRVTLDCWESTYSPKHRCVVRFGEELRGKHAVYLMRREGAFRVGRTAMFHASVHGLFGPIARAKAERADALWLLSVHDTAEQAALAEALVSFDYGIPDACFEKHGTGALDPEAFWGAVRSRPAVRRAGPAVRALEEHGRRLEEPFWTPGSRIGLRTSAVVAACNLIEGMRMLPFATTVDADRLSERKAPIQSWRPIREVSRERFVGDLISLEVEDCHTYFADGLLTHNSWRGAVDALSTFEAPHKLPLQQSHRFGPAIAAEANRALLLLGSDLRVSGTERVDSHLARLTAPSVVLTRTNAEAISRLMNAQIAGVRAGLVGGTGAVESLALAAQDLASGQKTTHPELLAFDTWAQVQEFCVLPATRVLTQDLRWVPAGLLEPGDDIVGFDEEKLPGTMGRRWRRGTVESVNQVKKQCVRVTGSDGTEVVCSVDHKWFVTGAGVGASAGSPRWVEAGKLTEGMSIVSLGTPWSVDQSRDAGWLAGIFDGEGNIGGGYSKSRTRPLSVSQNPGPVLDRIESLLKERAAEFAVQQRSNGVPCRDVIFRGNLPGKLRFLGEVRPERLVAQAHRLYENMRVERLLTAEVVSVEPMGEQIVCALRTDCRTFVAEGWLSHNCSEDKDAKELATLVKLVDTHGPETLLTAVQRAVPEQHAELVISTAHKAKGREWSRVALASDFPHPFDPESGGANLGELRLAYVAITRAQHYLDSSGLEWAAQVSQAFAREGSVEPALGGRVFLDGDEVPPPPEVPDDQAVAELPPPLGAPGEQLVVDPASDTRLLFRETRYDAALVAAQKELPGSRFRGEYLGEQKVRMVTATPEALDVARRFRLRVSPGARERVEGPAPAEAASPDGGGPVAFADLEVLGEPAQQ